MLNRTANYDRAGQSLAPRDVEAAAFLFVNRMMEEAGTAPDRIKALGRNHRLWSLLLTDIGLTSNQLPLVLKKDLVSIGAFSMSYSIAAMGRDLSLKPLIRINADMVEALRPAGPVSAPTTRPMPHVPGNIAVAV